MGANGKPVSNALFPVFMRLSDGFGWCAMQFAPVSPNRVKGAAAANDASVRRLAGEPIRPSSDAAAPA